MASSKTLKHVAFTLMALFGLLGGMFVAGYAFEDPGGWAAVAMTAAWVLPLAALAVFALVRPETAGPVLAGVTVAVGLFTLADSLLGLIPRDDWGPVAAVVVFALGVALAFLGLRRALLAGTLMVAIALTQLVATVAGLAIHIAANGGGPAAGLGTSSGVVVVPILMIGALFVTAGRAGDEHLHLHRPQIHPAH